MSNIEEKNELNYTSPALIRLNNIGATCFMNATLQFLSQTESLTIFYFELIQKLREINGSKSFSPNNFIKVINNMNPLFKTGQVGDSKDFIIFILEQLHKELKKSNNYIKNNRPLNQYDKNNAFDNFFNEFQQECSILSDIFFGISETTNECLNCKNIYNSQGLNNPICYNYGKFNCLIFPLEEIKEMKNNSGKNENIKINNNCASLYECFNYNQKTYLFTGENQNYCDNCKQLFFYAVINYM